MGKTFDAAAAGDRLITAVRNGLDALGRTDIALERDWLTVTEGHGDHVEAILTVPIGKGLSLPLKSLWRDEAPETVMERFAEDVFQALPNIERARWGLRRYAADTRRAAEAAIAQMRADGLDVTLAGVGLRRTYAWHMTQSDWKEAADHVIATVRVNGLDHRLTPSVIEFYASEPADVVDEMAQALDEQMEFQEKRDALGRQGATVAVDVVTLGLLFEHDLGFGTISDVVRLGHKTINLMMRDGSQGLIHIVSSGGEVRCSMHNPAGRGWRWCMDRLELTADPACGADEELAGRNVAELTGDSLFKDLTVASARRSTSGIVELAIDTPMRLFNADTGRFLRQAA